jgi:hypothetical protein
LLLKDSRLNNIEGVSILSRAPLFSRAQIIGALALLLLLWLVFIFRFVNARA